MILSLYPKNICAQQANKNDRVLAFDLRSDTIKPDKYIHLKDLTDVIKLMVNKSKKNEADTAISGPVLSIIPAIGYSLQTKLAGVISGNIAFRADKNTRLSAISGNITYTQNKQFYIPIQSNIWTKGNKYNLAGDYRFYKYPQSTFGLGSNSSPKNEDPMDYKFARFYQVVYKKIKEPIYAGLGYIIDYRWDISHSGIANGAIADYEKYGPTGESISSGITLNALYDTRDNLINAYKGFYTAIQLRNNFTWLGSNDNWQSLIVDVRKYIHLKKNSPNVLAFWSYNWIILKGHPPYLDLPSNGWDTYNCTGRGYIQGRFRGSKMMYMETEYRFKLVRNGLFGAVVFANAETFATEQSSSFQKIQPGFGAGLRIKLKKSSRTNLGIDYGFGTQGSRGLFINVGEYF